MAAITTLATTQAYSNVQEENGSLFSAEMALLLMAAISGVAMTKKMHKQYGIILRKALWLTARQKLKGMLGKKQDQIAGMEPWLFILLAIAASVLGVALLGLWGFIVIIALGAIIYFALRQSM